jgi:hypothetical protein
MAALNFLRLRVGASGLVMGLAGPSQAFVAARQFGCRCAAFETRSLRMAAAMISICEFCSHGFRFLESICELYIFTGCRRAGKSAVDQNAGDIAERGDSI